uniref:Ty3 transposon capsid-like protein domain-containing protein n=1 Tax=Chromera velia CCMP2878 TaxID=1169474 RepID=A0A0G4IAD2_9ALVE|eukprot:Cvel_12451.t1-p1 / transcript=Cvel_12451.t1 / gene=Cvel_12451 / organism=Chromera_velia_CCMP2878 / gene_product=hypothetical protein / transcript_product=hypothetical protein / location=Cvel_scaffold815:41633-44228(-) / protein_length=441 / sequence_SO=supercontig / SO=protein_coding / is_pseudo=false
MNLTCPAMPFQGADRGELSRRGNDWRGGVPAYDDNDHISQSSQKEGGETYEMQEESGFVNTDGGVIFATPQTTFNFGQSSPVMAAPAGGDGQMNEPAPMELCRIERCRKEEGNVGKDLFESLYGVGSWELREQIHCQRLHSPSPQLNRLETGRQGNDFDGGSPGKAERQKQKRQEKKERKSSPAGANTDIGPSHYASKVVELLAKLVFSGKREELQRWLKDVEDFFELNEVRESKKMKMAKGRLPAYLKEWYEKYQEEHGVFSNWESLKTELTERLKVTMKRSIARAKLQALHCTEALGVEKYNEAFSQLVGQLPHLWEEDVVEDYIKELPNSIALDVAKAKTYTLLEIQKEAAEIEAFLSSRAKGGGHRDFRLRVPESGGVSSQRNQPLVPEEGPIPMDLYGVRSLLPPLTPDERTHYIRERRCFRCCLSGHSANRCPGP